MMATFKKASAPMAALTLFATVSILVLIMMTFASALVEEKSIDTLPIENSLVLLDVIGPESLAFDPFGRGPFTGVSDGRVIQWQGPLIRWTFFGVTSNTWPLSCFGNRIGALESKCGRPLGLQFNKATGDLYIADSAFGLVVLGPEGGKATLLADEAEGQRIGYANGLDIDQETGVVYFTDSSSKFHRKDYLLIVISGDSTGRLLKYDPHSKKVTVLLRSLPYPNSVAISEDKNYLLITETGLRRVMKYWLCGPKAGTYEHFADVPGYPDNIRINPKGEFWVALTKEIMEQLQKESVQANATLLGKHGSSKKEYPVAVRLSKEGQILEVLDGNVVTCISEVLERDNTLYLGSASLPTVGVYEKQ